MDDAMRIVLVLELREAGSVRGVVELVRLRCRVRAVDIVHWDRYVSLTAPYRIRGRATYHAP